ncbi:MAG: M48 family metalloprotease [Balneola sp.]
MLTKEQLEASFSGDIEKVNLTFLYKIALFLISFTMILLPLIYFGIVFFAGWGVIFFAKDPFNVIESDIGFLALFVQYAGPVIISVVILIFMIKPFFVRLIKPVEGIIVKKDKEPLLFEFIEIICKKVNAPIPKQVLLNADANAAAGFKPGMMGFLTGDLRLIIGLPLVATMSVSQLGGILAHEFGHFSQGAGMRLSFVVRVISNWFSRVVFERDRWDEKLESWSTNTHIALALILGLARIGVWLSRKVLFVLMMIGNLVSTVMLRQMEFDADRYEIRFGGSRQFVKTTKKLKLISINWAIMYQGVFESWSNKKLSNDIPMYLAHKVSNPNEQLASHIEKEIEETKTGFFDTHPSDKERIENAKKENSPGIFNLDVPALQLFRNFERYSLKTSVLFYKNLMNDDYKDEYLVDLNEFLENDKTIEQNDKALLELFKGAISVHFPINFSKQPELEPRPDPEKEIEEITDFLEKNSDNIIKIIDSKYNLVDDRLLWKSAELIVSKGSKVNPKEFKLESGKMKEIDAVLQELQKRKWN